MAFQNVIMPQIKLMHGVTKQVIDPVLIVGNGNRETRRKQNRYERFIWSYPARSILDTSKQELHEFFRGVNMALDSFLFQDPDFPEFYNTELVHKTGSIWYLELPNGHPVINPVMGGLVFKVNGTTKAATFAIDADGRPTVDVTDSSAITTVTVSGPVYMTVRLNSPIAWTLTAFDQSLSGANCAPAPYIVDLSDIELIEVFERA